MSWRCVPYGAHRRGQRAAEVSVRPVQSYGDFGLNICHAMTKPDKNLWAAVINQNAAFDAV